MAPINQQVISGLHIMVKEVCEIFLSCKITQDSLLFFFFSLLHLFSAWKISHFLLTCVGDPVVILALCRDEPHSHVVQRSLWAAFAAAPDVHRGDNSWYRSGESG